MAEGRAESYVVPSLQGYKVGVSFLGFQRLPAPSSTYRGRRREDESEIQMTKSEASPKSGIKNVLEGFRKF
jgi:hypothetical protein